MRNKHQSNFGIGCMEVYIPKPYVSQSQLEQFNKVTPGKYTIGLGQEKMSFVSESEDATSMALNVLERILKNYKIDPKTIGRLEVGTETLVDKSKSIKTSLMQFFAHHGNQDIEGAMSVNACYGGTAALFNSIAWMESSAYDGRQAIVIMTDVAVYPEGPARPTGGAGAIAILITADAPIVLEPMRSSYMNHIYDFYKPNMESEYPLVNGQLSINNFFESLGSCYSGLKMKYDTLFQESLNLKSFDQVIFHSPFHKQVKKAFVKLVFEDLVSGVSFDKDKLDSSHYCSFKNFKRSHFKMLNPLVKDIWKQKCEDAHVLSKVTGNIYTGSLYLNLISYLINKQRLKGRRLLMFSYGSGSLSTMFVLRVNDSECFKVLKKSVESQIKDRVEVETSLYSTIMMNRELSYNKFGLSVRYRPNLIRDGAIILTNIDKMGRRYYLRKEKTGGRTPYLKRDQSQNSANSRLLAITRQMLTKQQQTSQPVVSNYRSFYMKSIEERMKIVLRDFSTVTEKDLSGGGLSLEYADKMIENCIGKISLPLGLALNFEINSKKLKIPMVTEEPSVIAAASGAAKFIRERGGGFETSSTDPIMIGQIQILNVDPILGQNRIQNHKSMIIDKANSYCQRMVKRGGGVQDLKTKIVQVSNEQREMAIKVLGRTTMLILELSVNVCDSMGANLVNTICEKIAPLVAEITKGRPSLKILSNLCIYRKATASFSIPLNKLAVKGFTGPEVAKRILESYLFAKADIFRAVTHNKGVLNGIDAVALATGQDWRAIEAAAHASSFFSNNGSYGPLTHYKCREVKGKGLCLEGKLEIPISVGTRGGAIHSNPIYINNLEIMGRPNSKTLAEIMLSVGLAQNFAALKALALEGIQKGHMKLHARNLAISAGVPLDKINQVVNYMIQKGSINVETAREFLIKNEFGPKF